MIRILCVSFCVVFANVASLAAEVRVVEVNKLTNVKDKYPYWSPDGTQIVFQSDRSGPIQLWIMNADGSDLRRVTHSNGNDENPIWTPDGRYIVFASDRDGNQEIYRMRPDGTELVNLTNHPAPESHPKISYDGTRIIFNSGRASDSSLYSAEWTEMNHDIYSIDIDGGDVRRLTHYDDWDTYPSISPDGTQILWRRVITNPDGSRNSEVFIANRDGSNPRNVTNHLAFDGYPAWSPDGETVLFASNRDGGKEQPFNFNIYAMNPDGTGLQRLTDSPGYEDARPIWSLDGKKIVFNRQINGRDAMEIFVMEVD